MMKALLRDTRSGDVAVYDVPEPELPARGILVRTSFSAVSTGTELAASESSQKSLATRVMARPDLVRNLWEYARNNGIWSAYQKAQSKLNALTPVGYSCSGIVVAVGREVSEFRPGERVACAGGGYATHSAVNAVPRNLAAQIPDGVSLEAASVVAIGAIAMQGIRQARLSFGETVAVIGAGLVGSLTIQLAKAAGCRVVALDLDSSRAEFAKSIGANLGLVANDPKAPEEITRFSRHGVDAAIITAATKSSEPVELAAAIMRDRGRIVVLGDVGMGVARDHIYNKELSILSSRSYGPGRYDTLYEEDGIDYPVGYVRWTENRNMEAFLSLLRDKLIDVGFLLQRSCSVDIAPSALCELKCKKDLTLIIKYQDSESFQQATVPSSTVKKQFGQTIKKLKVACIGAGSFATDIVLPNLQRFPRVEFTSIATASGVTAESVRRRFGFLKSQTPMDVIHNPDIHAIFVLTRHASHSEYVVAALAQEKMVFVEKPLAVTSAQLREVQDAYENEVRNGRSPFLMVGFNRRFAPFTESVRQFFAERKEPMVVHIRVNAGFLPISHWVHQTENGGRIVGELCHFVDWSRHIVNSPILSISAAALPDLGKYRSDNVLTTLHFADGSLANLLYLANGDPAVDKEYFEVYCEGRVARLRDFVDLELTRGGVKKQASSNRNKGHRQQFEITLEAMCNGSAAPISFGELLEVTEATFKIQEALQRDTRVNLGYSEQTEAQIATQ